MTVAELIAELQKLPQDQIVYARDCSYCAGTDEPAIIMTDYLKWDSKTHRDVEVIFITGDYDA